MTDLERAREAAREKLSDEGILTFHAVEIFAKLILEQRAEEAQRAVCDGCSMGVHPLRYQCPSPDRCRYNTERAADLRRQAGESNT